MARGRLPSPSKSEIGLWSNAVDEHFAEAIRDPDEKAAQNQAQSTAVTAGMSKELPKPQKQNRPDLPSDSEQLSCNANTP